jgi:hypothetical protein
MINEKSIAVLNTLIGVNNDRIEGYDTALRETEENDLKTLFSQLIQTSEENKTRLRNEVLSMGGTLQRVVCSLVFGVMSSPHFQDKTILEF